MAYIEYLLCLGELNWSQTAGNFYGCGINIHSAYQYPVL